MNKKTDTSIAKVNRRAFGSILIDNYLYKDNNIVVYLIGQLGRDSGYNSSVISSEQMLQDCYLFINSKRGNRRSNYYFRMQATS